MRSRDGNSTFSLSICALILFSSLVLNADEYLVSYRYVVKDAVLYNEALDISNAMKKCEGEPQQALYLDTYGYDDLQRIISKNSDEFIDYMHKLGLHVNHKELTVNMQNTSTTILTLKTTCFEVEINEKLAKIAPLK